MEWIKIPTDNILYSEFKDDELIVLIKYQALYCQIESEPTDAQMIRVFSKKEIKFLQNFREIVKDLCEKQIKNVSKKRNRDKEHYKQKQALKENSASGKLSESKLKVSVSTPQIRLDKIREDKSLNTDSKSLNENNLNTHTQSNLNISPCVREEFLQRAKKLEEILSKFHKIEFPQEEVAEWGVEIATLQKQNKIPLKRMDKVLKMLSDYIDEDYIPTISNGKDFRTKFIALEKQLEKVDSKYDWKVEW